MTRIDVIARAKIAAGKQAEFRRLAGECLRTVRERDTGTLEYEWFLDSEQGHCVVRESYRDSAAVLEHIAHLGPTLGAILGLGEWSFEVFGAPTPELAQAAAGLSPRVYASFQRL